MSRSSEAHLADQEREELIRNAAPALYVAVRKAVGLIRDGGDPTYRRAVLALCDAAVAMAEGTLRSEDRA